MVAVFHRIGEPTPDLFTHSIDQVKAFKGEITFDGVYESVFHHRLELPWSTLFVSGNQIGREGYCNRDQLEELANLGHDIGWHGWSHDRLTLMGKIAMESELRKPVWVKKLYAYPHGDFNKTAIGVLQDMGYEKAFSTTQGESGNVYAIPRFYV